MEITVKRDVKIDSDDVLERLSNYINAVDKKNGCVYVRSEMLKDIYDLIKHFIDEEKNKRVLINGRYYLGDISNVEIYSTDSEECIGRIKTKNKCFGK